MIVVYGLRINFQDLSCLILFIQCRKYSGCILVYELWLEQS